MADVNFDTFLNKAWGAKCGTFHYDGAFFIKKDQTVAKLYFFKNGVNSRRTLGKPTARGSKLSYEMTSDAGEKGIETIELVDDGYRVIERIFNGVQEIKNGKFLKDNTDVEVIVSCAPGTDIFEYYVKARNRYEKFENLLKLGHLETNVIDLIVDIDQYAGKKVLVKCWVNLMDGSGGNCRSEDDAQSVVLGIKGIDKDFFKWLLSNCPNRFANQNSGTCKELWVTGTVVRSSPTRLEDVRYVIDY